MRHRHLDFSELLHAAFLWGRWKLWTILTASAALSNEDCEMMVSKVCPSAWIWWLVKAPRLSWPLPNPRWYWRKEASKYYDHSSSRQRGRRSCLAPCRDDIWPSYCCFITSCEADETERHGSASVPFWMPTLSATKCNLQPRWFDICTYNPGYFGNLKQKLYKREIQMLSSVANAVFKRQNLSLL